MDKPWADYRLVKETVGLRKVLDHYGVKLSGSGNVLLGRCPLPMHGEGPHKTKQSFRVNLSKGIGGAWSCHSTGCVAARGGEKGGNCIDFVKWMEGGLTFQEACLKIQEWCGLHPTPTNGSKRSSSAPAIADEKEPVKPELISKEKSPAHASGAGESDEPNLPLKFELQGIDPKHPYLGARGILEETARTFGCGLFSGRGSMAGRVVIPIHNETGELVAYAGRALQEGSDKYKFPPGFRKSLELYNAHRVIAQTWPEEFDDLVIVVEGFFSCMKLWQMGVPAVALMGSSLSDAQAEIICSHWYEAVLMFDGDLAGRKCTDDSLGCLGRDMWVRALLLKPNEQPDHLTGHQIRELLDRVL